ncbi:MAG: glycosyltransferase family 2 protein [Patescibacteria group bacterium]
MVRSNTTTISKDKKIQQLKKEIRELQNANQEIHYILDNKIKASKTYRVWQFYNKIKKGLRKLIYVIFLVCFIPIYYLIIIAFFVIYKVVVFFTIPKKRELTLTEEEKRLDGVSFIIPTWNKKTMVIECVRKLDAILSNEGLQVKKEVIVYDNGSKDSTIEGLKKLTTTQDLTFIRSETNLGFAKAVNKAVENAKFNYIYLLNNDMIPQENFFNSLIEFVNDKLSQGVHLYGVASQIFFFDKTKRREESGKTYIKPFLGFMYAAHFILEENLKNPSITAYVGGGSSLINKHLFLKLGGLDAESYKPLYVEDLDLSFNAWKKGYSSFFLPSSQIIHHHRSSSKLLSRDPSYYMYKNFLVFMLKNVNTSSLFIKNLLMYPVLMLSSFKYIRYALEITNNLIPVLRSKIRMSSYKDKYSDKELLNFITFENKFHSHD